MSCVRLGWCVRLTVVLGALVAGSAGPPCAADPRWIDEGKVGVLAHDIRFLGNHVEPGADVNVEVLFPSPAFLHVLGEPRPHLGGAGNTTGKTDKGYNGMTRRGRNWNE